MDDMASTDVKVTAMLLTY